MSIVQNACTIFLDNSCGIGKRWVLERKGASDSLGGFRSVHLSWGWTGILMVSKIPRWAMKKGSKGSLGDLLGIVFTTQLCGDYHKPWNTDPPKEQPVFHGILVSGRFFLSWLTWWEFCWIRRRLVQRMNNGSQHKLMRLQWRACVGLVKASKINRWKFKSLHLKNGGKGRRSSPIGKVGNFSVSILKLREGNRWKLKMMGLGSDVFPDFHGAGKHSGSSRSSSGVFFWPHL